MQKIKISSSNMTSYQSLNSDNDNDNDDDRPSLSMGERIVWISDNGPEYGNVRWLGKLPDLGSEWMAGVEFENPVGSGTGLYKDKQLFVTPLNHASLVPIIGLLKASDFDEPPQPPIRDSSVKLIDINHDLDYYSDYKNRNASKNSNYFDDNKELISQQQQISRNYQDQKQNTSRRIRNIPIRIENKDEVENSLSLLSNNQSNNFNANKKQLSAKSNEYFNQSSSSNVNSSNKQKVSNLSLNELTTNLNEINISNRDINGINLLPSPPLDLNTNEKNVNLILKNLVGKSKGIQGHNNSCYLDATLFAMFSSTTLFDSLLYRPPNRSDIPEYKEIQRILREDIVRPLRNNFIVNADQVMLFRTLLEQSSSVEGLTDEEKDPEEFLSLLLSQILKAEPYLKLSSGLESFFYQLIVDKDESVVLPSVQDLFEQSFMNSTVRLRQIPPCLLLQMPRFGRQYKMYPRIMPSLKLDITDVLETVPRSCGHRGKDCDNIAKYECKDCFGDRSSRSSTKLSSITYCSNCFQAKHFGKSHSTGIEDHDKTKTLLDRTPLDAISRYSNHKSSSKDKEIPRVCMDLFAVLCIETSHYVCFVKCGQNPEAPWCFFDSMADRRGEQNGYNIPEVLLFDEFGFWTSDKGIPYLLNHKDDKLLPEMARRLICDAYLCFYQYPELNTYR